MFARRFVASGERGWAIYSVLSAVVFLVAFILASIACSQTELMDFGGLFQRIALTVGFGWLTLLAVYLLRAAHARSVT